MPKLSFSERHGLAPAPQPKGDTHLPGWVRESVGNEIREFAEIGKPSGLPDLNLYAMFRPHIWKVLDKQPQGTRWAARGNTTYLGPSPHVNGGSSMTCWRRFVG